MIIQKSQRSSLQEFETFWQAALAYQTERNLPLWSPFPKTTIAGEISESRHFSWVVPCYILAGFFSITLAYPVIWGEAVIDAPGKVMVKQSKSEAPKGALGPGQYQAKHIIIATGARPRVLPGLEPDKKLVWTYFEAMVP